MTDGLHEECGLFGCYMPEEGEAAAACYFGLFALQHRGQESCGIVVNRNNMFYSHKDNGLVNDVFTPESVAQLGRGNIGLGHVRYGTTGGKTRANAQPLVVNHIKGVMAVAHNGSLCNAYALRRKLEMGGAIFHTNSDSEVIAYMITRERLKTPTIEEAILQAMDQLQGAYSLVVMSSTKLIAVRDPRGFRPLCIGRLGDGYVFASETCALDAVGAVFLRDVEPGEVVVADGRGLRSLHYRGGTCPKSLCVFEFIYFARPDSVVEGSSVHTARKRAGAFLALQHPVQADVVIGVPDSGIDAALGYAQQSGIPYDIGFIKNKYIGRTFIDPGKTSRETHVKIKLNVVSDVVKGKRVVMVDDSIVRGTTCARIVWLLREAGATEVHMRSSAPPFLYPCYYGTDIHSREDLIAAHHSVEEIAGMIDVDSLGYLDVNFVELLADRTKGFCTACFNGKYPVHVPDTEKEWLSREQVWKEYED
ncbi:MAG: amidophosphoribosyltransferase [Christensenellales bacterium]